MNRGLCIVWAVLVAATSSPSLAEERKEREDRQVGAAFEWSSFVEGWGGAASFRQWRGRLGVDVGAAFWKSDKLPEPLSNANCTTRRGRHDRRSWLGNCVSRW